MTDYDDVYPKLGQFLGCYFHQDWSYEQRLVGGSFENIVHNYVAENPVATVRQATRELEEFLGLDLSEDELHDIVVHDLGANVRAAGLGLTYRQWLEAVLAILKKPAGGSDTRQKSKW
jgi:hypothetical protein